MISGNGSIYVSSDGRSIHRITVLSRNTVRKCDFYCSSGVSQRNIYFRIVDSSIPLAYLPMIIYYRFVLKYLWFMKKRVVLVHSLIYLVKIIIVSQLLCILRMSGKNYFNLVTTSLFWERSNQPFLGLGPYVHSKISSRLRWRHLDHILRRTKRVQLCLTIERLIGNEIHLVLFFNQYSRRNKCSHMVSPAVWLLWSPLCYTQLDAAISTDDL